MNTAFLWRAELLMARWSYVDGTADVYQSSVPGYRGVRRSMTGRGEAGKNWRLWPVLYKHPSHPSYVFTGGPGLSPLDYYTDTLGIR